MDLNETSRKLVGRHPWELSRTECILGAMEPYLADIHEIEGRKCYINVGAGDLYFDRALMKRHYNDIVYAVDIGYAESGVDNKFNYLEEIQRKDFDYAIMMDSLEYFENDIGYVDKLSKRVKKGGYLFFTLPAFQNLYSEHDIIVGNLRRYNQKSFDEIINKIPCIVKEEAFYFYFTLLCVRGIQKGMRLPIDPEHKVTTGWKYDENSFVTKFVTEGLDLDFKLGAFLGKHGIRIPGLSLFVVCKKTT